MFRIRRQRGLWKKLLAYTFSFLSANIQVLDQKTIRYNDPIVIHMLEEGGDLLWGLHVTVH